MSRSKKRTPIIGICSARSEKQDKRSANRLLRRKVRVHEHVHPVDEEEIDDLVPPLLREISNVWAFGKDGKQYLGKRDWPGDRLAKYLRK